MHAMYYTLECQNAYWAIIVWLEWAAGVRCPHTNLAEWLGKSGNCSSSRCSEGGLRTASSLWLGGYRFFSIEGSGPGSYAGVQARRHRMHALRLGCLIERRKRGQRWRPPPWKVNRRRRTGAVQGRKSSPADVKFVCSLGWNIYASTLSLAKRYLKVNEGLAPGRGSSARSPMRGVHAGCVCARCRRRGKGGVE